MGSGSGQPQGLIRTVTRMAYEVMENNRGTERTNAVMLSSFERGNHTLYTINLHEVKEYARDILTRHDDLNEEHLEHIHEMYVKGCNDLGIHENICNLMRSEIGYFGTLVPRDFGSTKLEWTEFIGEYSGAVTSAGTDLAIKGPKGTGKSDFACLLGEATLEKNGTFATNIPIKKHDDEERYERVHHIGYLSDLMKLRLKIPMSKHITMAIDEAEPVFKKLLGNTLESRNIIDFFNLTRKYDISIISIWHFDDDIPDQIMEMTKSGEGLFFNKQRKTAAFVNGRNFQAVITKIPSTTLDFISTGVGSAASFYVDLNIKKLNQQTAGITDSITAKKILIEALNDPGVYLKGHKHRAKNYREKNEGPDIEAIAEKIIDNLDDYLTESKRALDHAKITLDFEISQHKAKEVRSKVMRTDKYKNRKKVEKI
jgi:hypothetical protein